MTQFTHLHVHSQYSLLDGASDISRMIKKVKNNGMTALALTDHGNLMGIKEFHVECLNAGIKPLLGCEAYVAARTIYNKSDKIDRSGYHLIIIAKNKIGYQNLTKLVSISHLKGDYYKPRIDRQLLENYKEGLIICSACLGGEVPKHIMNGDISKAEETIMWYKQQFREDYYLEIMRHPTEIMGPDEHIYQNQIKTNKIIIELAKKFDIKIVATNDAHFINEEEAGAHDLLICLNTGKDLDDPKRMRYTQQEWLKTKEEMAEVFSDIPEALENTMEIAEKVEVYELDHKPIMPLYPIPNEFATIEQYREKYTEESLIEEFGEKGWKELDGDKEKALRIKLESDYLEKLVLEGAEKRYTEITDEINDRILFEINTIKTMGFPGYFLIVQDFVNKAREMEVLVGPGRGSAAGSIVAYCTGITNIDPIKYNLLFERFLNPERISMPDVDIDFDDDNRDKVIHYVINKYGQDKVAHICTFLKMKAKMAMKDVARVLKVPLPHVNAFVKKFPDNTALDNAYNYILEMEKEFGSMDKVVTELDKQTKKLAGMGGDTQNSINLLELKKVFAREIIECRKTNNQTMLKAMAFACTLEGSIRQSGVHPCGVLIGKDDLTDNIPLMQSKDEPEIPSTQYDGKYVESIGLLKMDFLGLRTLSIIKDCIENIEISQNTKINIDEIDPDDKKAFSVFQHGNTTAIFQFESEGMKKSLRRLKPNRFEDLVAMNALYRPGPMDYIPDYIARKHGRVKIEYDHPIMEEYLAETYGITVFQEQVMLLSRALANFTRGESDTLRKAMGKKNPELMEEMHAKFIEGCRNNPEFIKGCEEKKTEPDKLINKIWTDWSAFAKYAFNKSHSVCYAQIAYITAFLKANYPAEFMAGNLSRNLTDISKIMTLMKECNQMKIKVLGPSVNESFRTFTVNNLGAIRFGLAGIKNVGTNAVENIIEEREANGNYKDIFDFASRVNLSIVTKKNFEALAYAGAFDEFDEIKRHQFFAAEENNGAFIEELAKFGNNMKSQANTGMTLFGEMESIEVKKPEIPTTSDVNTIEFLNQEKEHIGMYLSGHPLDEYKFYMQFLNLTSLVNLNNEDAYKNGREIRIAGFITNVQERLTKTGNPFGTMTLMDYSGSYTFSLFGKEYINFKNFFIEGISVLINGKFVKGRKDEDSVFFSANNIKMLKELSNGHFKHLKITVPFDAIDNEFVKDLKKSVEKNKGDVNLNLCIYNPVDKFEIKLFSRTHRVKLNNEFIDYIETDSAIDKLELT
jgi:DNA polymerase III subunit alpha